MTKRLLTIRFSKNHFFTLLAAGLLTAGAQAQTFAPYTNNPFSLGGADWQRKPTLVDIDADGDLDLFMGSTPYADVCHLVYYQNTGTAAAPTFAAGVADPFGFGLIGNGMAHPAFVDLDNDGDFDLMVGSQDGTSRYYVNTGTATACQFSSANSILNPFGLYGIGFWATPAFADLDSDGDKDLLMGEYYGDLRYFQNTGTASAPAFTMLTVPAYGMINTGLSPKPVFRDIDNDGDQDLFVGVDNGRHVYFQNTGTASAPAFAAPVNNPFGLTSTPSGYCAPTFGDLDNDGDADLISGTSDTPFHYFRNTSPVPSPINTTPASALLVCHGTSTTLTATGVPPGTLKWYDAPTNGTLLGQGPSYTTAPLTLNRTFYVEDNTSAGASATRTAISVSVTQQIHQLSVNASQLEHCGHGSSFIQVIGTPTGVFYTLRNDLNDTIVYGPVEGSGFWVGLPTGDLTATTTYNVLAQTINGSLVCEKEMTQTVTVTIKPLGTRSINADICHGESYTYLDGTVSTNITADESHESILSGQAANGCDSIVTENLNVLPVSSGMHFATLCYGDSVEVNGTYYGLNNPFGTEVFTAANGCDSTVMVMLMMLPEITGSFTQTICHNESVEVNGTTYNAANPSGTEVFTAANGCDSTVTVSLNVLPQIYAYYTPAICHGETMEINGTIYGPGHLYGLEVFTAANGCDSLVTVNASMLPEITGSYNPTVCFGEAIEVNGTTYDANNPSGTEIFTASNGCDSTVTVSLNILPELTGSYTATMCAGEEIEINGTIYNAANPTGTEVLSSVDGCDSTVTINLSIFTAQVLIYPGSPGLLSAEPNDAEYQWINCTTGEAIAGATEQSFTAEEFDSYAVIVTFDGCTDTSNCATPAWVGIADHTVSLVKLYPNPATTSFQLSGLGSLAGIQEMSLMDMNGKLMNQSTQAVSEWNITDLAPGVYWLQIAHKTGVETLRFIKE